MDECKHEKSNTESCTKTGSITNIIYRCNGCGAVRKREIFSVRLGPDGGFTCCSDDSTPWTKECLS